MKEQQETEKLIQQLREAAEKQLAIATAIRTEQPECSMFSFKMSEILHTAANNLEKSIPHQMEVEGGGTSWWYVCPNCHGAIDKGDRFCRHCGQAVEE